MRWNARYVLRPSQTPQLSAGAWVAYYVPVCLDINELPLSSPQPGGLGRQDSIPLSVGKNSKDPPPRGEKDHQHHQYLILDIKARCPNYLANPPIPDFAGSIRSAACPQCKRSFAPEPGHIVRALHARGLGDVNRVAWWLLGCHETTWEARTWKVLPLDGRFGAFTLLLPYVSHPSQARYPILDFQALVPSPRHWNIRSLSARTTSTVSTPIFMVAWSSVTLFPRFMVEPEHYSERVQIRSWR